MQEFELRRRSDGLVYHFARDGVGVYRRTDRPEMTIQWDPQFGWVARDPETAELAGQPWGVPPAFDSARRERRTISVRGPCAWSTTRRRT